MRTLSLSKAFRLLVVGYSLVWLATGIYMLVYSPLFAWDGLSFWGPQATNMAMQPIDKWWPLAVSSVSTTPLFVIISAVFVRCSAGLGVASPFAMLTVISIVFGCLVAFLKCRAIQPLKLMAPITFTAVATVPVVENMYLATGYSDVLVHGLIGAITIQIFFICNSLNLSNFVFLMVLLLSLVGVKETGIVYVGTCFLALAFVAFVRSGWKVKLVMGVIIGVCVVLFLRNSGYVLQIFELKFGIRIYDESLLLHFAEKRLELVPHSVPSVVNSTFHSIFINLSFSVIACIYFCLLSLVANRKKYRISPQDSLALMFALVWATFTVLAWIIGQIWVPYINEFSSSAGDTGGTRLILPITACVSFSVGWLSIRSFSTRANQSRDAKA